MNDRATIDFETRSACPLRKSGSWRYSQDPTTDVLCLAFHLPYWEDDHIALWHPAFPHLGIEEEGQDELRELFYWILGGGLVEAHNAWFERGVWHNIMVPRYGWPSIGGHQWRCSAAKAAAHSLPRSLDDVAAALRLKVRKDLDGSKMMKKMNKPRKPRKKEVAEWKKLHGNDPMPLLYHESPDMLSVLWEYCRQDVRTEMAVSRAVPDLSPSETSIYCLDQTINQRGFQLDTIGVGAALTLIESESARLNTELSSLTGGKPSKATQRRAMQEWLADQWFVMDDMKGPSLTAALKQEGLSAGIKRGLELVQELGRASTAKYEAMRRWACDDGRVRGGLLYHGASTGRWSGAGVQPHNFPRGSVKDVEGAWNVIKTGDTDAIRAFCPDPKKKDKPVGNVLRLLSEALRGAIISSRGKLLFVADYAAIEARVLLWLAEDEEALEIFRRGEDIYCDMASSIYGRPVIANPDDQPPERKVGKEAILGLGYQMGAPKFHTRCASYGIILTEEFAEEVVEKYRRKYWRVKQLWYDQESAAIQAVRNPGTPVRSGRILWQTEGDFLFCTLPSNRRLAYPFPKVKSVRTSWGKNKTGLTYMGTSATFHKWHRQTVYGGLLVENIVQAISRDIMAEAAMRCEESLVYEPILTVHDELIAEANEHLGNVKEFVRLVAKCPDWAQGCPIEAEGWAGRRYRK